MAPSEVILLAKQLSVKLWVDTDEEKVLVSPVTRTTSELRAGIVANKAALLTMLREPDANGRRGPPMLENGDGPQLPTPVSEIQQDEEDEQPKRRRHREKDWFAVPDRVRFVLLHKDAGLGDAELRVYLFLVGQTMGWGAESDDVSLKQISEGITRKDGVVRSTGTGLSARAIITALESLKDFGLITIKANRDDKRGKVANTYALVLEGDSRDPLMKPTSHAHMKPTSHAHMKPTS